MADVNWGALLDADPRLQAPLRSRGLRIRPTVAPSVDWGAMLDAEAEQEMERPAPQQQAPLPPPPQSRQQPAPQPAPQPKAIEYQGTIYEFSPDWDDAKIVDWFTNSQYSPMKQPQQAPAQQQPAATAPQTQATPAMTPELEQARQTYLSLLDKIESGQPASKEEYDTLHRTAAVLDSAGVSEQAVFAGRKQPVWNPPQVESGPKTPIETEQQKHLKRLQTGSDAALSFAREELAKSWFPNLRAVSESAHNEWISLAKRAVGKDQEADYSQVIADAWGQAADEISQGGMVPAALERAVRNTLRVLPDMVVAGQVAGPYGALGLAGVQEGNRSITKGRKAGKSGGELESYAATQGAIEFGIGALLQGLGWGGVESIAAAKEIAVKSFTDAGKRLLKTTGQELVEEIPTEQGHNVADVAYGVDPNALSLENIWRTLSDTILGTFTQSAAVSIPSLASGAMAGRAARLEKLKGVQAKGFVSEQDAKDLGLPPEASTNRKTRGAAVKDEINQLEQEIKDAESVAAGVPTEPGGVQGTTQMGGVPDQAGVSPAAGTAGTGTVTPPAANVPPTVEPTATGAVPPTATEQAAGEQAGSEGGGDLAEANRKFYETNLPTAKQKQTIVEDVAVAGVQIGMPPDQIVADLVQNGVAEEDAVGGVKFAVRQQTGKEWEYAKPVEETAQVHAGDSARVAPKPGEGAEPSGSQRVRGGGRTSEQVPGQARPEEGAEVPDLDAALADAAKELAGETPAEGTESSAAKEPWMMTREEWWGEQGRAFVESHPDFDNQFGYEMLIEAAVKAGKDVPLSVRKQADRGVKPWEWTRDEFVRDKTTKKGTLGKPRSEMSQEEAIAEHQAWIERAVREGKPVPAEVLADYPDLATTSPQTPAAAEPAPEPAGPSEAAGGATAEQETGAVPEAEVAIADIDMTTRDGERQAMKAVKAIADKYSLNPNELWREVVFSPEAAEKDIVTELATKNRGLKVKPSTPSGPMPDTMDTEADVREAYEAGQIDAAEVTRRLAEIRAKAPPVKGTGLKKPAGTPKPEFAPDTARIQAEKEAKEAAKREQQERVTSEGYAKLPEKSRTRFDAAWDGDDAQAMKALLDPSNKALRAEFERRAGVKLPRTIKGTGEAVDQVYAGRKPAAAPVAPEAAQPSPKPAEAPAAAAPAETPSPTPASERLADVLTPESVAEAAVRDAATKGEVEILPFADAVKRTATEKALRDAGMEPVPGKASFWRKAEKPATPALGAWEGQRTTAKIGTPERTAFDAEVEAAEKAADDARHAEEKIKAEMEKTGRYTKKHEALEKRREKAREKSNAAYAKWDKLRDQWRRSRLEDAAEQTENPIMAIAARLELKPDVTAEERRTSAQQARAQIEELIRPMLDEAIAAETDGAGRLSAEDDKGAIDHVVSMTAHDIVQNPLMAENMVDRVRGRLRAERLEVYRSMKFKELDATGVVGLEDLGTRMRNVYDFDSIDKIVETAKQRQKMEQEAERKEKEVLEERVGKAREALLSRLQQVGRKGLTENQVRETMLAALADVRSTPANDAVMEAWKRMRKEDPAPLVLIGEGDKRKAVAPEFAEQRKGRKPAAQAKGDGGRGTGGGVQAQMMPEDAEPGMPMDFEQEAGPEMGALDRTRESTAPDEKAERLKIQPVPTVELVQLIRDILGSVPGVKKLRKYLGYFKAAKGSNHARIVINAIAGKDENLLAKVLAHEAGHMIDWLPDNTLDRGNILGRIGSLRNYLKHWLEGFEGGPGPLTDKERARLRREAERLVKEVTEVEIEEEIVKTFPITPEDIINIWNSVDASNATPELMRYIKQLSNAEKLSIIKEAFKGAVPEEVQRFARTLREKTGKKIKQAIETPATPENISAKYQELLRREIEARRLFSLETIKDELIKLTEWWTPYDKRHASKDYIKYRESSRELYAEALSVFLNSPGELAKRAPEFYRGFTEYLGRKPELLESFFELQDMLNGEPGELSEARAEQRRQMYATADQKIRATAAARQAAKGSWLERFNQFFSQMLVQRGAAVVKRARTGLKAGLDPVAENAYYAIQELAYAENVNHVMLNGINDILQPLYDLGVTDGDLGDWLFFQRVVNERNEIINPQGYTPRTAAEELEWLKGRFGGNVDAVQEGIQKLRDLWFGYVERAVEAEVYSQKAYQETLLPKKDTYATFAVTYYLQDNVPASLRKQTGTFQEIGNPLHMTIMKMVSMNRLAELNRAKRSVLELLKQSFPDDVRREPLAYQQKEPSKPAGPGREYLLVLEDGKPVYYSVPTEIAGSFMSHDVGRLARVGQFLQSTVYKVFHPLYVTFSPSFVAANPFRDLRRTWRNLGTIGHSMQKEMQDALVAQGMSREQAKQASKPQKITIGQLAWAAAKALPVGIRRARGITDPIVDEMLTNKALAIPFVQVDPEMEFEGGQTERLLQQHGIKQATGSKTWSERIKTIPLLGHIMGFMEGVGVAQETMTKVAGYRLLRERGVEPRKAAGVTRRYVGTPDFKQRGLATSFTNALWMYSNVRWQGLSADLELATGRSPMFKHTAAGFWWRAVVDSLLPTSLNKAALYGLFGTGVAMLLKAIGDDDEEWAKKTLAGVKGAEGLYGRIGGYHLENYDIIPLGVVMDRDGNPKTAFISIPDDDVGAMLRRIFSGIVDASLEATGVNTRKGNVETALTETAKSTIGAVIPNTNPALNQLARWGEYVAGENPKDSFTNREIVPSTEWTAGGWYRLKKMLSWTAGQYGVAGELTGLVLGQPLGTAYESGEQTWTETALSAPGLRRLIRITDRGLSEQQWVDVEAEDTARAELKLSLPSEARSLTRERAKLNRLGDTRLTKDEQKKRATINAWFSGYYTPQTRSIEKYESTGKQKEADAIRDKMRTRAKAVLEKIGK